MGRRIVHLGLCRQNSGLVPCAHPVWLGNGTPQGLKGWHSRVGESVSSSHFSPILHSLSLPRRTGAPPLPKGFRVAYKQKHPHKTRGKESFPEHSLHSSNNPGRWVFSPCLPDEDTDVLREEKVQPFTQLVPCVWRLASSQVRGSGERPQPEGFLHPWMLRWLIGYLI